MIVNALKLPPVPVMQELFRISKRFSFSFLFTLKGKGHKIFIFLYLVSPMFILRILRVIFIATFYSYYHLPNRIPYMLGAL